MKGQKEEKIGEALMKVALGYQIAEVTEEYAEVDGALKLTKRKKTKKDVPPDLKAVQLLLSSEGGGEYSQWSDEELEKERRRLLEALQEKTSSENLENKSDGATKKKGAVAKKRQGAAKEMGVVLKEKVVALENGGGSVTKGAEGKGISLDGEKEGEGAVKSVQKKQTRTTGATTVKKPRPKPRKRIVRKG